MRTRRLLVPVVLTLAAVSGGCFSRTLTVETDPAGARVFVAHEEVGVSPVTIPFNWGGRREILVLHEDGEVKYKPLRIVHDSSKFFYDTFPFDVLTDLVPIENVDDQTVSVQLEVAEDTDGADLDPDSWTEAILGRAELSRERARRAQDEAPPALPPLLAPVESGRQPTAAPDPAPETPPVEKSR